MRDDMSVSEEVERDRAHEDRTAHRPPLHPPMSEEEWRATLAPFYATKKGPTP